jgi:hypothetical protein
MFTANPFIKQSANSDEHFRNAYFNSQVCAVAAFKIDISELREDKRQGMSGLSASGRRPGTPRSVQAGTLRLARIQLFRNRRSKSAESSSPNYVLAHDTGSQTPDE